MKTLCVLRLAGLLLLSPVASVAAAADEPATAAGDSMAQTPHQRRPARPATATISGRVVDATTGDGIPRARVHLGGLYLSDLPDAITDENGDFRIDDVRPGVYQLRARRVGYVYRDFGPRASLRFGVRNSIRVLAGQEHSGVRIGLSQAGAISGRVVDERGEPVEHAPVRLFRASRAGRPPRLFSSTQTNDIGEFRLAPLDHDTYFAEAHWGEVRLRDGTLADGVPTFYPGVMEIAHASPIRVDAGQPETHLEIGLLRVPTALITGTVTDPNGAAVAGGYIQISTQHAEGQLSRSGGGATIHPDGTFRFRLPSGHYRLDVWALDESGAEGGGTSEELSVAGEPAMALALQVGPPARLSGRIVFDGTSPRPDADDVLVILLPDARSSACRPVYVDVNADWTFEATGLSGTCRIGALAPEGWVLRTIWHQSTDLADQATHLPPGQELQGLRVVFTDRITALNFAVVDERGVATSAYAALVFSTDRRDWELPSGVRTYVPPVDQTPVPSEPAAGPAAGAAASAEPAAAGRRAHLPRLMPGEYFGIAVDDAMPDDLEDPAFLEILSRSATRFTLYEGETRTLHLKRVRISPQAHP